MHHAVAFSGCDALQCPNQIEFDAMRCTCNVHFSIHSDDHVLYFILSTIMMVVVNASVGWVDRSVVFVVRR